METKQKMTETNKNSESKKDMLDLKLDTLLNLIKAKPELLDVLLDNVVATGNKKRKNKWRGRVNTLFPNGEYVYLTPTELVVKGIVDVLVDKKTLSKIASVAGMNKFYSNSKIRGLSKTDQHFAKQYYKQYILDWSQIKMERDKKSGVLKK